MAFRPLKNKDEDLECKKTAMQIKGNIVHNRQTDGNSKLSS